MITLTVTWVRGIKWGATGSVHHYLYQQSSHGVGEGPDYCESALAPHVSLHGYLRLWDNATSLPSLFTHHVIYIVL